MKLTSVAVVAVTLALPSALLAQGATPAKAVLTPVADLKWIGAWVPGVETAASSVTDASPAGSPVASSAPWSR